MNRKWDIKTEVRGGSTTNTVQTCFVRMYNTCLIKGILMGLAQLQRLRVGNIIEISFDTELFKKRLRYSVRDAFLGM